MKRTIALFFLLVFPFLNTKAQKTAESNSKPFVLGITETIASIQLSETRTLNIYLPEGYNENPNTSYPVIYLLDGSADEDFIHIAGLVQFANFSWVNMLPKSIVVGIANIDRRRDLSFPTTVAKDKQDNPTSGGSEKFIAFIEKELQPYIHSKYRADSNAMLIGQSLGGLLATEILFKKPYLFNQYIIVSPSLWWDNESLLAQNKQITAYKKQDIKVYIGVGKEGDRMETDAKKLFDVLQQNKTGKIKSHFKLFEDENHATILHHAAYDAIKTLAKP